MIFNTIRCSSRTKNESRNGNEIKLPASSLTCSQPFIFSSARSNRISGSENGKRQPTSFYLNTSLKTPTLTPHQLSWKLLVGLPAWLVCFLLCLSAGFFLFLLIVACRLFVADNEDWQYVVRIPVKILLQMYARVCVCVAAVSLNEIVSTCWQTELRKSYYKHFKWTKCRHKDITESGSRTSTFSVKLAKEYRKMYRLSHEKRT